MSNGFSRFAKAIWNDKHQQVAADGHLMRQIEALLFASPQPLSCDDIARRINHPASGVEKFMNELADYYKGRGVNLQQIGDAWALRTAPDLDYLFSDQNQEIKPLSKAAMETLAIIAYNQPVTRADIEFIRGVTTSKGVMDVLLKAGLIRMGGRRKGIGRAITYKTTDYFLDFFNLTSLNDLPGIDELKGAGLLGTRVDSSFKFSKLTQADDGE